MTQDRRHFTRIGADGTHEAIARAVAEERPLAIEFNGIGYAVMMATPADLDDFIHGFASSERLIDSAADILDVDTHDATTGTILRAQLVPDRAGRVIERVRHRVSESSCGLCGIENLEQALRPLPRVQGKPPASKSVFAALSALGAHQALNRATGAVHGAALCAADGTIRVVREDVGRHNALDKVVGHAFFADGLPLAGSILLVSGRVSFEIMQKALAAGIPAVAAISAPTSAAVEFAHASGQVLVGFLRGERMNVYAGTLAG